MENRLASLYAQLTAIRPFCIRKATALTLRQRQSLQVGNTNCADIATVVTQNQYCGPSAWKD